MKLLDVVRKLKGKVRWLLSPRHLIMRGRYRRTVPSDRVFGLRRGRGIDRYYIEAFMERHASAVKGVVLEVADPRYTRQFGRSAVTHSDVLHAVAGNAEASLVGNLATGEGIPENRYDCIILTQVLQFIYDVNSAVIHAHRALRPGGVLLVTVAGISQISRSDMDRWGDYWRFTDASARRLFGDVFGAQQVTVESHGNVFAACAFLQALAAEDLCREELELNDPDYQLLITVRAKKAGVSE